MRMRTLTKSLLAVSTSIFLITPALGQVNMEESGFYRGIGGHPFEKAILDFKSEGILQGYPDGQFRPNAAVNRAEFVKILLATKKISSEGKNCFPDVQEQWFAAWVCAAAKEGFVRGYPDGLFHPERYINFAESARILARAYNAPEVSTNPWYRSSIEFLAEQKSIPYTITGFDHVTTRGETAVMLWSLRGGGDEYTQNWEKEAQPLTYAQIDARSHLQERVLNFRSKQKSVVLSGTQVDALCTPVFKNNEAEEQAWRDSNNDVATFNTKYCPNVPTGTEQRIRYFSYYTDTGTFQEWDPGGYEEMVLFTASELKAAKQKKEQPRTTDKDGFTTWSVCYEDQRVLAKGLQAQAHICNYYHESSPGEAIYVLPNTDCYVPVGKNLYFGFRIPMAAMDSAIDGCEQLKRWGIRSMSLK